MPLGTEYKQPTRGDDFVVLRVGLSFVMLVGHVPFGALRGANRRNLQTIGIFVQLAYGFLGHELGIATQQNVGAASRHVGRDCNRSFTARLSDDVGLARVILGVQDLV